MWYQELVRHLKAAKKWLAAQRRTHQGFTQQDKENFLQAVSDPLFWWARFVEQNQISLEQIAQGTPESTAKEILALDYDVESDTIHSRLFRSE